MTPQRRALSRGALAGGFSKESLLRWGLQHWNLDIDSPAAVAYSDLFSETISPHCAAWLRSQARPSSRAARAFYSSRAFLPERILLSPFHASDNRRIPSTFALGDKFLAWTVVVDSPHETILEWNLGNYRGCTMVALDPSLRRVYHGNVVDADPGAANFLERGILLGFHPIYAQTLLAGMVRTLEHQAREETGASP